MSALAHTLSRRRSAGGVRLADVVLIVLGSAVVALLAQVSFRLPFTPVPITGQTLGVLLVGASLGSARGSSALLLYLAEGAAGLPVFAEAKSGLALLATSSVTGGYLWGFVVAAFVVGWLAERGWDRNFGSAIGAMLVGLIVIFSFGCTWLAAALSVPAREALELGLYPFVLGDLLKLLIAAGSLPLAWRIAGPQRGRLRI